MNSVSAHALSGVASLIVDVSHIPMWIFSVTTLFVPYPNANRPDGDDLRQKMVGLLSS